MLIVLSLSQSPNTCVPLLCYEFPGKVLHLCGEKASSWVGPFQRVFRRHVLQPRGTDGQRHRGSGWHGPLKKATPPLGLHWEHFCLLMSSGFRAHDHACRMMQRMCTAAREAGHPREGTGDLDFEGWGGPGRSPQSAGQESAASCVEQNILFDLNGKWQLEISTSSSSEVSVTFFLIFF